MAVRMTAPRKGPVRRLAERSGRSNLLLAEAIAELLRAWAAVRFLPFRRAVASGSKPLGAAKQRANVDELVWAVTAASAHVPWRTVCFQQGLAVQRMLRRRRIDARLHYGVGYGPSTDLQAHVWVTVGNDIVIGAEQAASVRCVASYPAAASAETR